MSISVISSIRVRAEEKLSLLMQGHNVSGHSIEHMIIVADHATNALKHENLNECDKIRIELAALLHDADDSKIFKDSKNYQNARSILKEILTIEDLCSLYHKECRNNESMSDYHDNFIESIIEMIDLVSCSKNGDSEPKYPWMAIPRDCDRLEAIGQIGIDRCFDLTVHRKNPFHTESTQAIFSEEELWKVATIDRFKSYMKGNPSISMIDHFYDKLLHIGKPNCLRSQNIYILEEASKRNQIMIDYVINYWKQVKMGFYL